MKALRYIGDGRWTPGVPAADVDVPAEDAERLVASGLYAYRDDAPQEVVEDDPAADHSIDDDEDLPVFESAEEGVESDGE